MAILFNFCLFAFAAIQAIAAFFTIWDRIRWKRVVTPDLPSPNQPNTDFHFLVAGLLILGAVVAGTLGGYLSGHPIQQPSQPVANAPCPATNTGNTGSATARAGQSGTAIGHSGHGDTDDINSKPKQ
jgi:hypothetical protein